jgi:S2P endopeptidase
VTHQKDGLINCCGPNNALNCFENVLSRYDEAQFLPQFVCLDIRNTIENSNNYCHSGGKCDLGSSCLKPILNNFTTIIQMKRLGRRDLIYYGHPADIVRNAEISGFVPKTNFLGPSLADRLTLLLKYLFIFSSGLAIVNVIPCYGLDGQFLVNALITNLDATKFSKNKKDLFIVLVNLLGSTMFFIAVVKIFWSTFGGRFF